MIANSQQDRNTPPPYAATTNDLVRVLLVVEGTHDIEFLRRISSILHTHDRSLPHLAGMERRGEVIFIPFGGGRMAAWTHQLAPLAKPEFYLCDRELPPKTEHRRQAVNQINRRERCHAVLTRKRSIENYFHPLAISAASDIEVEFDDFDPVAEIVAKRRYQLDLDVEPWELLTLRARKRMTYRVKRWLNTRAAELMTVDLLHQRDPDGEVISWLTTIRRLAELC